MGYYLIVDDGVTAQGIDVSDDRTEIILGAAKVEAGAIVRCPETGRWSYDRQLRLCFGIDGNPDFETRHQAGEAIQDHAIPMAQLRESLRHTLWPKTQD